MKALSVRQPWAWLIIHAGKDIENRSWSTSMRGRILVHAAKLMTEDEYDDALDVAAHALGSITVPHPDQLQYGGIVGSVDIVGCVHESTSPWFFGPFGFQLRDPRPLSFTRCRGYPGFFNTEFSEYLGKEGQPG